MLIFKTQNKRVRIDQRGRSMGINSYKFSQLYQWLQFICTKQMHEFIFYSYFISAISKFLIGKMSLKNKFENRFSKPDFGFQTENRFSINIPNLIAYAVFNYLNEVVQSLLQLKIFTVNALIIKNQFTIANSPLLTHITTSSHTTPSQVPL